ncbi:hypothetical protein G6O69_00905 [Pseudenhygromyxa sp. WMMC2535]|uniref:hypothetical protein n=1 Tax=Pseudenhygromyxa sp. WMMC2535 TaxID=2712867 RepID=UPI001558173E|nr:hypothetical protein [Pseudenhygromyxa sp. WMMC2535]NVB36369.1 hypothetical protein [Pseudenhygromyxa sp. WMMC2535]
MVYAQRRRALTFAAPLSFALPLALCTLTGACKAKDPLDASGARKVDPEELPRPEPIAVDGNQLRAAGVEITVPSDWQRLDEDEPNFAFAYRPSEHPAFMPICAIELRRQGTGPMPKGVVAAPNQADAFELAGDEQLDYTHGTLRGRVRTIAGPTPDARVVVHCRMPRSADQWKGIEDAFASLRLLDPPAALPEKNPAELEIAELCTGAPARRSMVCARTKTGAVHCGASTSTTLPRVPGLPPAVELECAGMRSCIRDGEGEAWCWLPGQDPVELTALGHLRALAGGCVIDSAGAPSCPSAPARTIDALEFTPLIPLGDPSHALREVVDLLPDSDTEQGCALHQGKVSCWSRATGLREVEGLAIEDADAIAEWTNRLCVHAGSQWTCVAKPTKAETEAETKPETWTVEGCEQRACGCSLIGAAQFNCEHEPIQRIDTRPLGRIHDVVAIDSPCAAQLDGTLLCRGPAEGSAPAEQSTDDQLAHGLPGLVHRLELVETR